MQQPWGGYGPPPGPYAPPVPYTLPGNPSQPTAKDISDLRTLAILTIVYGAFIGIFVLFGLLYVVIGIAVAASPPPPSSSGGDPALAGGMIAVIGLLVAVLIGAKATLLIMSGIGMMKRKWKMASYVAAALSCMNMPLGTILGVFTFLVLGRPAVRALYEGS